MDAKYYRKYVNFLQDLALTLLYWKIICKSKETEEFKLKMLKILKMFGYLTNLRDKMERSGEFYRIPELVAKLNEIQEIFVKMGYNSGHRYIKFTRDFAFEIIKYHEIKKKIHSKSILFELYEQEITRIRKMREIYENFSIFSGNRKDCDYLQNRIKLITLIREKLESEIIILESV